MNVVPQISMKDALRAEAAIAAAPRQEPGAGDGQETEGSATPTSRHLSLLVAAHRRATPDRSCFGWDKEGANFTFSAITS